MHGINAHSIRQINTTKNTLLRAMNNEEVDFASNHFQHERNRFYFLNFFLNKIFKHFDQNSLEHTQHRIR